MAGERLVVASHLSDWMLADGQTLRPSIIKDMQERFSYLREEDFEVFNIADELDYDLSPQNLAEIRPISFEKIYFCHGLISVFQENLSEGQVKDVGYAIGIGKPAVMLAHTQGPNVRLKTHDKLDIEQGRMYEIHRPLEADEIRETIAQHRAKKATKTKI